MATWSPVICTMGAQWPNDCVSVCPVQLTHLFHPLATRLAGFCDRGCHGNLSRKYHRSPPPNDELVVSGAKVPLDILHQIRLGARL